MEGGQGVTISAAPPLRHDVRNRAGDAAFGGPTNLATSLDAVTCIPKASMCRLDAGRLAQPTWRAKAYEASATYSEPLVETLAFLQLAEDRLGFRKGSP